MTIDSVVREHAGVYTCLTQASGKQRLQLSVDLVVETGIV